MASLASVPLAPWVDCCVLVAADSDSTTPEEEQTSGIGAFAYPTQNKIDRQVGRSNTREKLRLGEWNGVTTPPSVIYSS